MEKLTKPAIIIGAVGTLALSIGSIMGPHPVAAQGGPAVTIVSPLPLLVKNTDERGRTPFHQASQCSGSGAFCDATFAIVPANKRLVVEEVSTRTAIPATSMLLRARLNDGTSSAPGYLPPDLHLVPQVQWSAAGITQYGSNNRVLWYADAGRTPRFQIFINPAGAILADVTVTGYLVDLTK